MRALAITAVLLTAAAPAAFAQQWSVEAQAGRIRSALDPVNTNLESVVVAARFDQLTSNVRISVGVPTSSTQPLWGAVGGAHRFVYRTNRFVAGVDASGSGFVLHDRVERMQEVNDVFNRPRLVPAPAQSGLAGALQAMPLIGFEASRVHVHVRAGLSHYASEFAEQTRSRSVRLADAQLTFIPTSAIAIAPAIRYFADDAGNFTFAGVTTAFGADPVNVWGTTGRWLNLDAQETTWAAGAALRVHNRATITASGRRDVLDPLYGTPGQTAWSAGVNVKLGRVPITRVPVPAVFDAGHATIRLPATQAPAAPRVAGDFNNWKPQPMERDGDVWVYRVALQPGVYNYAFVDAEGEWFVPEKYPGRKQDGMGGVVAVVVVR